MSVCLFFIFWVTCYSQNADSIIQINDYFVDSYDRVNGNQSLQEWMFNETKHTCGQDHDPKFHGYTTSQMSTKFDEEVAQYIVLWDRVNLKDHLRDIVYNPYYFEFLLKAYLWSTTLFYQ